MLCRQYQHSESFVLLRYICKDCVCVRKPVVRVHVRPLAVRALSVECEARKARGAKLPQLLANAEGALELNVVCSGSLLRVQPVRRCQPHALRVRPGADGKSDARPAEQIEWSLLQADDVESVAEFLLAFPQLSESGARLSLAAVRVETQQSCRVPLRRHQVQSTVH